MDILLSVSSLLINCMTTGPQEDKDREGHPGLNTDLKRQTLRRNLEHSRGFRDSGAGSVDREKKPEEQSAGWPQEGRRGEVTCWGKGS